MVMNKFYFLTNVNVRMHYFRKKLMLNGNAFNF